VIDLPTTLAGWATLVASVTFIAGAWTGTAMAIGKRYIGRTVGDVVRESIDTAMQPVHLQLVTMNGELVRVREIEAKLENGLMSRTARIEDQLGLIVNHLMFDDTGGRDDGKP